MRKLIASLLLATLGIAAAQAQTSAADSCKGKTVAMLEALQRGDDAATTHDMSAFMRMMNSPESLQQTREELAKQYGAWQSHDAAQVAASDSDSVTLRVPLVMVRGKPTAVVICNFKEKAPLASLAILAPGL
jgi:hypothetical protein